MAKKAFEVIFIHLSIKQLLSISAKHREFAENENLFQ